MASFCGVNTPGVAVADFQLESFELQREVRLWSGVRWQKLGYRGENASSLSHKSAGPWRREPGLPLESPGRRGSAAAPTLGGKRDEEKRLLVPDLRGVVRGAGCVLERIGAHSWAAWVQTWALFLPDPAVKGPMLRGPRSPICKVGARAPAWKGCC